MKRKIIPYDSKLKRRAKELRSNMTLCEVLLWKELKGKKLLGCDFDRQRPIDNYIVDFYCKDLQLAIEVDGDSHLNKDVQTYDKKRQRRLESLGVNFLRFDDIKIKTSISSVMAEIKEWIEKHSSM